MNQVLLIIFTALIMEPITAFTHRYIMHDFVWAWHKSHHDRYAKVFELNDLFPVVFSILAVGLFILGINNQTITSIAIGITIYGAIYFVVHEIIIHSRFFKVKNNNKLFHYWRFGHNVHHQYQAAPFGFIVPITPRELKLKAKENPRDLIDRFQSKMD